MKNFIPLLVPCLNGNEKKYLSECVESTYVSSAGKFIEKFENKIQQITNSSYVTTLNSGTSALHLSLIDAGVKSNDLVITSNYTFIATANAINYCGADPVLIDVDGSSFNINFDLVEKFMETECELVDGCYIHIDSKRRVSAFLPVMALGNMLPSDDLSLFKKKYSIPIILDAAAGIGSHSASKKLGELTFDYATLSFNGNKTITCGAGGAILTPKNNARLRHLAATARKHPTYLHDEVGYNYRITNTCAAIGLAQIELLDEIKIKKNRIYNFYKNNLSSPNFTFYDEGFEQSSCKWLSGFRLNDENIKDIENFVLHLNERGIGASKFWEPLSEQAMFKNSINLLDSTAKKISDSFIVLPSSPDLKDAELEYIVKTIIGYWNK